MGWIINLVGAGTGLFAVFMGLLYKYQGSLLYFPSRGEEHTPAAAHLHRFEDCHFKAKDGTKLHGWLIKQQNSKDRVTLIMFHGNAGNLSNRLYNAQGIVNRLGCNLFMVSYRGYGHSAPVTPSEEGLKQDAQAALEYALAHEDLDPKRIAIFGRSLGGAVAIHLAYKNPDRVAGIILENTFTSIPDMVDAIMPVFSRLKFLITNPWFSDRIIQHVTCPILFVSGAQDELVPPKQVQILHDAAVSSKSVHIEVFEKGHHNDTWLDESYYIRVGAWIAKVLGSS